MNACEVRMTYTRSKCTKLEKKKKFLTVLPITASVASVAFRTSVCRYQNQQKSINFYVSKHYSIK